MKKKKVNRKKILIAIISIIAVIYILYTIFLLRENGTDTIFVEQGTIHKEETVVGYIIRNETVIKDEEYKNGIIQITGEGEKVSKNEAIFQYYSNSAKELTYKIEELDLQIQKALENENINLTSDIKLIENQIEEKVEKLRILNNTQEISEYNKTIKNLLKKKIDALGEATTASENLKQLIKQRKSYEEQIANSTQYITAPMSGIVSYRVDGLEGILTPSSIKDLTIDELEKLDLKTGQIIATSTEAGKVIDNFKYYIATPMYSEEAINAEVGDKVNIRLSTNDEIKAKIVQINEQENGRILVFEIDRITEKLINYRKISFDVIWWSDTGLKVPNKSILKDEEGLTYIVRTKSGYLTKLLVKVIKTNENYSIVTSYDTEELTKLGYSQEQISSYKKVKLYDEILLHPK